MKKGVVSAREDVLTAQFSCLIRSYVKPSLVVHSHFLVVYDRDTQIFLAYLGRKDRQGWE